MQITEISVTMSEVSNLGDYSSTKPSVSLKATLTPDEIPAQRLEELIGLAKTAVHDQIDRERLTRSLDPLYFTGPAYDVFYNFYLSLVLVLPAGIYGGRKAGWTSVGRGRPLDNAQKEGLACLQDHHRGDDAWQLLVCVDIAELPAIELLITERQQAYDEAEEEKRQKELKRRQDEQEAWERRRVAQQATSDDDADDEDDEE
jgi:hypothetical protein